MVGKFFLWFKNVQGATAIEYGLIVAGISVVLMAVIFALGTDVTGTFQSIATALAG